MKTDFTFIDLFSGIGGFKMALTSQGGNCLYFSEIDKDAISTYCKNYSINTNKNLGDITKIRHLPKHDILTAGVPCQSWSIAGKNLGFDDDRGQLWNDTIFLLNQSQPKAFIFENVKGLADPRNKNALSYILNRIKEAGYYAKHYVINSYDHGVAQNRIRVYIIGFREKKFQKKLKLPEKTINKVTLADILGIDLPPRETENQYDLFGKIISKRAMSLSSKGEYNDYFLFNDLRNGNTTIHSWDIIKTTQRQKEICLTILKNRRKSQFGPLDGNPLSLNQLKEIYPSIEQNELDELVELDILKTVNYGFQIAHTYPTSLSLEESAIISLAVNNQINIGQLKSNYLLKKKKISIHQSISSLLEKKIITCNDLRYEFKNTKISSGINGINRIFMPSSDVFPTLVASDTNDYISLINLTPKSHEDYKNSFLEDVFKKKNYRKITKEEACAIQGFPKDFQLPESRARWMKLIGNSVSVPVIDTLIKAIIQTGVFEKSTETMSTE